MARFGSFLFLSLFFAACADDAAAPEGDSQYILEGYVYANRAVDHIKISRVDPSGGAVPMPVLDAQVTLSQGDESLLLALDGNCSSCYGSANSQTVFAFGDSLFMSAQIGDDQFWAKTAFPPEIIGLKTTANEVDLSAHDDSQPIMRVSWDTIPGYQYALFVTSEGELGAEIWSGEIPITRDNPFQNILSQAGANIYSEHLSHYGNYTIYVTAVDRVYAEFARARQGGGPASSYGNVQHANGIFTAFNGTAISLTIK